MRMYIGLSMSSHDYLAQIAGRTLSIKNSIESIGFISIVPALPF
jgi:hypothetical protein